MLTKCRHCGEIAVDDSEFQEVCSACGIVVEDSQWEKPEYVTSSTAFFTPFGKFASKSQYSEKTTVSSRYALKALDRLCHVYNLDTMCKAEIAQLFKKISSNKRYKEREDAATMVACCLLVVQRKNKQSIPISNICCELQCTRKKFSKQLKFLKSWLSSNENSHFLEIDSPQSSSQLQMADEDIPDELNSLITSVFENAGDEERNKLIKKTTDLVKLANSCWLLTGRSPKSVVVASAYLCWKSMHRLQRKASFPKFCSVFEIHAPRAKLRIPELRDLLLKLGRKIPSYHKNYVNEQNILFHLDTILENSETLRNDLFPEAKTKQDVESVEYLAFRYPPTTEERIEPECPIVYDTDMNASDIEISDSEIDSYIFSDKTKLVSLFQSRIFKKE